MLVAGKIDKNMRTADSTLQCGIHMLPVTLNLNLYNLCLMPFSAP